MGNKFLIILFDTLCLLFAALWTSKVLWKVLSLRSSSTDGCVHENKISRVCQNKIWTFKSETKFKRKCKRVYQNSLQSTMKLEKVALTKQKYLNRKQANVIRNFLIKFFPSLNISTCVTSRPFNHIVMETIFRGSRNSLFISWTWFYFDKICIIAGAGNNRFRFYGGGGINNNFVMLCSVVWPNLYQWRYWTGPARFLDSSVVVFRYCRYLIL